MSLVSEVRIIIITFSNFQHDTSSACAPGGSAGNFIMFARATSGDKPNNRLFSACSRSKMNSVMDVKGRCTDASCCFKGKTSIPRLGEQEPSCFPFTAPWFQPSSASCPHVHRTLSVKYFSRFHDFFLSHS